MHYLDDETEKVLIWLWIHRHEGRVAWIKERENLQVFTTPRFYQSSIGSTEFKGVKRKHLKQMASSKGYGGPLIKVNHNPFDYGEEDKLPAWTLVTITLTEEGARWADSPYIRSRHPDHPSNKKDERPAWERGSF